MYCMRNTRRSIRLIIAFAGLFSPDLTAGIESDTGGEVQPKIVETDVYGVQELGENEKQYVVLLRDRTAHRMLPIWIGKCEARAIEMKLQKKDFPRPLTHDLFHNVLEDTEVKITSILVDQLRPLTQSAPGGTYFAVMTVRKANGTAVKIDARPSDAMALAVRMGLSIFVSRRILDENGIEDSPRSREPEEPGPSRPRKFYE
ncbi:MAG: hypothetical protein CME25_07765 [Gemmatimonadetes bacterium]|nr:hypothetical protein [Gemmatimonadota bacterium]